jgi:hypothetical protein
MAGGARRARGLGIDQKRRGGGGCGDARACRVCTPYLDRHLDRHLDRDRHVEDAQGSLAGSRAHDRERAA